MSRPKIQSTALEVFAASGFDADAWHVMNERDNSLVAEEILGGPQSRKFLYSFPVANKVVEGISVVGARHLAHHYGGLRHRLISSADKSGALIQFTSYPQDGSEMRVSCHVVPELADAPDFYRVVVELHDIKTGNSIQMEREELRLGVRDDGTVFERPQFRTIAQSKAYRNAVCALIPQDVQIKWKQIVAAQNRSELISDGVLAQKRSGVLKFAAARGIGIDRGRLHDLGLDEIAGLSEAAREGGGAFEVAAEALGLVMSQPSPAPVPDPAIPAAQVPAAEPARRGRKPKPPALPDAAFAPAPPVTRTDDQMPPSGAPAAGSAAAAEGDDLDGIFGGSE